MSWLLPATCVRVFGDNVSTLATCRVAVLPGTCASSVMPWGTDLGFQSGAPLTRPGASGRSPTTRGLHVFRRGAGSPAAGCVWPDSRSSVPSERPVRARAEAAGLLWSAPASRLAHSPADSALPRRTRGSHGTVPQAALRIGRVNTCTHARRHPTWGCRTCWGWSQPRVHVLHAPPARRMPPPPAPPARPRRPSPRGERGSEQQPGKSDGRVQGLRSLTSGSGRHGPSPVPPC